MCKVLVVSPYISIRRENVTYFLYGLTNLISTFPGSPILLGLATLNCVVWHLFVDS